MKKTKRTAVMMPMVLLILLFGAGWLHAAGDDYVVKNLRVDDVPFDDGTALQLSWNPLHKDRGVIEYRVYRGVSPDSLFLIGVIPINRKVGVIGDTLYYYDKDYTQFLDINSSGKLNREEQQPDDSPLFRELPRDLAITGPMLKQYRLLGIIPTNDFLYRSHEVRTSVPSDVLALADTKIEVEMDEPDIFAGIGVHQIQLVKKLKPYTRYYYAVVAVDSNRKFHHWAGPVSGVASDNAPEVVKEFSAAFVKGKNQLQFEWALPMNKADIYFYNVYSVPADSLAAFEQYKGYLKDNAKVSERKKYIVGKQGEIFAKLTRDMEKGKQVSAATITRMRKYHELLINRLQFEELKDSFDKMLVYVEEKDRAILKSAAEKVGFPSNEMVPPAAPRGYSPQLLFTRMTSLPYTTPNYAIVPLEKDGKVKSLYSKSYAEELAETYNTDAVIDSMNVAKYMFVTSISDGSRFETFCETAVPARIIDETELPEIPVITVTDTPNDKGDYNTVTWGKPVCFLTNSVFTDQDKTRLQINYDHVSNDFFKIRNIYFEISDPSGLLLSKPVKINEFYQDNKIKISINELDDPEKMASAELQVKISFRTKNDKEMGEDYHFIQNLKWDPITLSLKPAELRLGKEEVNNYSYYIYKRQKSFQKFYLSKKISGNQRELNDNVSYNEEFYRTTTRFDLANKVMLVDASLDILVELPSKVEFGTDQRYSLDTWIYPELAKRETDKLAKDLVNSNNELALYRAMYEKSLADSMGKPDSTKLAQIDKLIEPVFNHLTQEIDKTRKQIKRMNYYGMETWTKQREMSPMGRTRDAILTEGTKTTALGRIGKMITEYETLLADSLNLTASEKAGIQSKIASLNQMKAATETRNDVAMPDSAAISATLAQIRPMINGALIEVNTIKTLLEHPVILEANKMSNWKDRLAFLNDTRDLWDRSTEYKIVKTDGKGALVESPVYKNKEGNSFILPISNWFDREKGIVLIATIVFSLFVFVMIKRAQGGHDLFIRSIAGIQEIDNAIGRATEMGRPILFVPGLSGISDIATLAGLSILGRVAKKAAEYDTRILVPNRDVIVLPIAQEIVREAHYEAGRPDSYDKRNVFFITSDQFPFVAGVNGIMIREKTAANFYMGMFWAEALIMTETGNTTGAIQIAGTDAVTQIPFFITTCDYTLIGEELYAASGYLARDPMMLGTLKAQDYMKFLVLAGIIIGTILTTFHITFFINLFPTK